MHRGQGGTSQAPPTPGALATTHPCAVAVKGGWPPETGAGPTLNCLTHLFPVSTSGLLLASWPPLPGGPRASLLLPPPPGHLLPPSVPPSPSEQLRPKAITWAHYVGTGEASVGEHSVGEGELSTQTSTTEEGGSHHRGGGWANPEQSVEGTTQDDDPEWEVGP